MVRFFREDFDRERAFKALVVFTFDGKGYVPGQSIDKGRFSVRRLRQLYDMRRIGYEAVTHVNNVVVLPPPPEPEPEPEPEPKVAPRPLTRRRA